MGDPDSAALEANMEDHITASLGPMVRLLRRLHSFDASRQSLPEGLSVHEIGLLEEGLRVLYTYLKDVPAAEDPSCTPKWWIKEVRELCYDTEDYFDEVMNSGAGVRRSGRPSTIFRIISKRKRRPQIAKDFSQLMSRVDDARERYESFKLAPSGQVGASCLTPRLSLELPVSAASISVHVDTGGGRCIVGVEEPMNKLVNLLGFDNAKEKQLKVIPIFGSAGVGKTTLARTLYHRFGGKFQCRAFLRVSRNPDMRRLLTSMLSQIKAPPRAHALSDAQDLIDSIIKHLGGKRYFIIIDDLWTASAWNIINRALPEGNCCSRIITTTQIVDVALACCGYQSEYIFELRPLNDEQSRKLFFNIIFGSEGVCPPDFEEVSYGIIRKCGGLPLATVNIASLLASKPKLVMGQWENVQRSLPSTLRTNPTSEGLKDALNLIYNDLPPHLKTCLLYFNMYPEGNIIRKDDLVKQWIAEALVGDTEHVARGYFDELVRRGMIQPIDTNYSGEVLSCTINHMVLDLIRYKSMEDNFIIAVDHFESTPGVPDKVRRLSVQFGGAKTAKIPESIRMSQVRSLLFCGFFKCVPSIVDYRLLQVLILDIWADQDEASFDLTRICELFRLRYLKIEGNITVDLPDKIQGLLHLRTLQIDARLSAVPSDIGRLEKLVHLRLPGEAIVMNLCKLTSLQDLHLTCSTVQIADNLENNMEGLGSILGKLRSLRCLALVLAGSSRVNTRDGAGASSLSIYCDGLSSVSPAPVLLERLELPRICIFPGLPRWFGELHRLCILKIAVTELSKEDIAILKGLPALTALSLSVLRVERIVFGKEGFGALRYFKFTCTTLCLTFEKDAMPNVQRLKLRFNANGLDQYDPVHAGFEHLLGLKEISAKIGSVGADEYDTIAAFSKTSSPIFNVQSVDRIFNGDREKRSARNEEKHPTSETVQDAGKYVIQGFAGEGTSKQSEADDSGTSLASGSSLEIQILGEDESEATDTGSALEAPSSKHPSTPDNVNPEFAESIIHEDKETSSTTKEEKHFTPEKDVTSLRTSAASEISSPQPEAALQTGATSEITSPQPEAPLQTRATSEISSHQPEAPLQTSEERSDEQRGNEEKGPREDMNRQADSRTSMPSGCIAHLQDSGEDESEATDTGSALEDPSSKHPSTPDNVNREFAESIIHEDKETSSTTKEEKHFTPEKEDVTSLRTSATSEISSPQPEAALQTGATSEITSPQPEAPLQTGATSEISSHQPEAPLQTSEERPDEQRGNEEKRPREDMNRQADSRTSMPSGYIAHLQDSGEDESKAADTGSALEAPSSKHPSTPDNLNREFAEPIIHEDKETSSTTKEEKHFTPEKEDVTSLRTGVTSEISSPQREAPLQTGATSEITSPQPEAPLQTRATSEISSHQPEAPLQTSEERSDEQRGNEEKGPQEDMNRQADSRTSMPSGYIAHLQDSGEDKSKATDTGSALEAPSSKHPSTPDNVNRDFSESIIHEDKETTSTTKEEKHFTPEKEDVTSLRTGVTSEISSPQPEATLQTGATSEITSPQPEAPLQTRATSEISSHQPEAPLQTSEERSDEQRGNEEKGPREDMNKHADSSYGLWLKNGTMEVAAGAMSPLLRKLDEMLVGKLNLEKRVKKNIRSLRTQLEPMHATIRKVGEVPPDQLDMEVRIWASKVRDLSYDMEDVVDRFIVHVAEGRDSESTNLKNKIKKLLKKTTNLFTKDKALHQISDAIEEARDLTKQLIEEPNRYKLEMPITGFGANIDPRLIHVYKDVTELVGIEEARNELIQRLTEGDEGSKLQLKTISIVGLGGLGKTTLAKAVYDKIKVQFDAWAFVPVSRNPDMKKILKDMLYELDNAKFKDIHYATRDERLLVDELRKFLEDKRYVIIIDDIWDEKAWGVIKYALPKNSLNSQVIITTRNVSVAEACCSSNHHMIYTMKPLSDKDSQRLFYRRIFHSETGCPDELQEVSRDILKKCGGLPLAIIAIASLLDSNHGIKPKDQWCHLLKSIGRGLATGAIVEDMKRILSFSYCDLPYHLKTCLLYLSIFPEDYEIERKRLIWRWIAEGFIQSGRQETSLFELGESYFNELVNRSMIMPVDIDYEGKARACRVHDMVLDLICSLSIEENFVTILDGVGRSTYDLQSKVRRLSLQDTSMTELKTPWIGAMSMSQVRSVSLFMPGVNLMPFLLWFEFLRVIDLEDCKLGGRQDKTDLRYLGNLLHLRYLGLRSTCIDHLPSEIGKLQFLQTLDIRDNRIEELPSSVFQLRQLMCLFLSYTTKVLAGLGNLVSLEELSNLRVEHFSQDDFEELSYLTKLRVLGIGSFELDESQDFELDESQDKALMDAIGNMHKLRSLQFGGRGRINFMPVGWVPPPQLRTFTTRMKSFLTLPKWINPSSLPLLSYLQICVVEARWEDIQIAGKLFALRFLSLEVHGSMEERAVERGFVVTADAFPCLRECRFIGFTTTPSMFPLGAMPMLQSFHFGFRSCDVASGGLDLGMGHLPSLEKVEVYLFSEEASDEEVEEAKAVMRHATDAHPNRPTLEFNRYWW